MCVRLGACNLLTHVRTLRERNVPADAREGGDDDFTNPTNVAHKSC